MSSVVVSLSDGVFCGDRAAIEHWSSGSARLTGASFLFIFVRACVTLGHNTSRGFHAVNTYSLIPGYAGHG